MKHFKLFLLLSLLSATCLADGIEGSWYGTAKIGAMNLRIVFNIERNGDAYTGYMQSPDQSNAKIPVTSIEYTAPKLTITISQIAFVYNGILKEGEIAGSVTQSGMNFTVNLSREPVVRLRPQEPVGPLPYMAHEVGFVNKKAGITLAGTLTIPKDANGCPAVVLVTGSGPQNRDEELLGHKPFLVLADYLTRQGIVVLRYDDRGTGESEGNYSTSGMEDFYTDALSAVGFLQSRKEVNPKKIGVVGHSEGGGIALMLAGRNKVDFAITMAAPGIDGCTLLDLQREAIFRASGVPEASIIQYNDLMGKAQQLALQINDKEELSEKISALFAGTLLEKETETTVQQLSKAEIKSILAYDPKPDLQKIKCPLFALNGNKDLQVPSKPNLEAIGTTVTSNGNRQVMTKEYPNLNHLFQTATTGLPVEYGEIEETMNRQVLEDIASWILAL